VEAHRQAARLIKKETELNGALEEFGHAAEQLVRALFRTAVGITIACLFDWLNSWCVQSFMMLCVD